MDRRYAAVLAVAALLVVAGAVLYPMLPATMTLTGESYDRAVVTVDDENGTTLGTVHARVADTPDQRWTGLSDTDALADDEGMLFVFRDTAHRRFVMREMAFPLDIVFVAGNGTVTAVHHAPVPPPGTPESELTPYTGRAKWVLEVNRGWTTAHGVAVGDRVDVEYTHETAGSGTLLERPVLTG